MNEVKRYRAHQLAKLPADSDDVVLASDFDRLSHRLERVERAFAKYGKHGEFCDVYNHGAPCNCGFDTALTAEQVEGKL